MVVLGGLKIFMSEVLLYGLSAFCRPVRHGGCRCAEAGSASSSCTFGPPLICRLRAMQKQKTWVFFKLAQLPSSDDGWRRFVESVSGNAGWTCRWSASRRLSSCVLTMYATPPPSFLFNFPTRFSLLTRGLTRVHPRTRFLLEKS